MRKELAGNHYSSMALSKEAAEAVRPWPYQYFTPIIVGNAFFFTFEMHYPCSLSIDPNYLYAAVELAYKFDKKFTESVCDADDIMNVCLLKIPYQHTWTYANITCTLQKHIC